MANSGIDLLAVQCGAVTAPAGCGKTHLIAEALSRHTSEKPILVLTHTNAGVAALRQRLICAKVPASAYRLLTIDGWSMRLISMFPKRSGIDPDLLRLRNPRMDYLRIRETAAELLKAGHINDILSSSYERVLVDEYQDCSIRQHAVITSMAQTLPTCVLGDPLQAIFGFGDDCLADWNKHVCAIFPIVGELNTPWRWINAKSEPLGQWLLDVRQHLLNSMSIDLRKAPPSVSWVELDGSEDHQRRLNAALIRPPNTGGCVLIIGDSANPRAQREFASQTPGACTVEAVDIRDLGDFAQRFDLGATDSLDSLVYFAQSVMTNVGAAGLVQRIQTLIRGTERNPPTDIEKIALEFVMNPSFRGAADLLSAISLNKGVRTYRPAVLRACVKALRLCSSNNDLHFADAVMRMREEYRYVGRKLPKRGVGSTLLLKGLEADAAVVLNANALDAKNLYVALTRGARALVVCSKTSVLTPCSI